MDPTDKQAAKYKSKNLMGYIQDKVDVGMTKLRSDEGVQLDVAILKATIQDAVVPKEKHVVTLKIGSSASAPRQQVNYVIHGLSKRLEEKSGWLVTLKTLIVFHRLLREVDPSFQEEIIKYQERTGAHRLLRLDGFADHTTKDTWDYSAWIRVYSVYLDERLGVFKSMRFDPELESGGQGHANATGGNQTGGEVRETKLKNCGAQELLERLPQIQRLLSRLISCIPEGAAQSNEIVLQSCVMVMRELKSTYRTVCEGIINLADKFFEMERSDALKALDAYKDNMVLNDKLNTFLSAINNVPALRGAVQMPALQSLPPDFLATMEEYVREAPKVLDPNSAARANVSAGPTGAPPATLRSSTMLRQSGTTSAAMTGTGAGGVIPAPVQGVLKIGPPTGGPPPVQPQPSVDLLGDDFSAPPAQPSPAAAAPQAYGQLSPQQPQQGYGQTGQLGEAAQFGAAAAGTPGYNAAPPPLQTNAVGFGFGDQAAFGSPPGAPTPGAQPAPPAGFNPFGSPPNQAAPSPHPQPGYGSPAGANPFGSGAPPTNPYGAPTPTATNPFAPAFPPPAAGPTGATNPFGGAPAPAYASTPGYGAPAPSPYGQPAPNAGFGAPQPVPTNPFGGAGPAWGQGPPQGAAAWGTNVQPGSTALKKQPDPLAIIGADLFGKSNQQPVQQSLRDMKQLHL